MAFAAVFLVVLLAAPAVFAKDYPVDWTLNKDYSSWATQPFNVGDKLVFTYDNTHSVDVVSKSDYESCDASNAIQSNSKSPTTITLKEGTTYIICGTPGHCSQNGGMKMQVTVGKAGSGSSPTPSGSTTPTPSGNTPSSPSAAGSSSVGHLMFGVPLVLGTLVAFMG